MQTETCETCDIEPINGTLYIEAGIFECDSCRDDRIEREYNECYSERIIARNYPNLHRDIQRLSDDPVGFYYACKNI